MKKIKHKLLFFLIPFILIFLAVSSYAITHKNLYSATVRLKVDGSFGVNPLDARILSRALHNIGTAQNIDTVPVSELRRRLSINPDTDTDIVEIVLKGENPRLSVGLVNEIANVYLAEISSKAKEAEEKLSKNKMEEAQSYRKSLNEQIEKVKNNLENSEKKLEQIESDSKKHDVLFSSLKQQLMNLEAERANLLKVYTPLYPDVVRTESDIKRVKDEIGSLPPRPTGRFELEREVESYRKEYADLKNSFGKLEEVSPEKKIFAVAKYADRATPVFTPRKKALFIVGGFVAAAIIGFLIIIITILSDTAVFTDEELSNFAKMPIAGRVPYIKPTKTEYFKKKSISPLIFDYEKQGEIIEHYRRLYSYIESNFLNDKPENKLMLFLSSVPREGKTTIACNTALVAARAGKRTLLMDCNLANPSINALFGIREGQAGLTDILNRGMPIDSAITNTTDMLMGNMGMDKVLKFKGLDRLSIITAGRPLSIGSELLRSDKIDSLITRLKDRFDLIVIDGPSLSASVDGIALSSKSDVVLMVYSTGNTPRGSIRSAVAQLAKSNGIVMNKCT